MILSGPLCEAIESGPRVFDQHLRSALGLVEAYYWVRRHYLTLRYVLIVVLMCSGERRCKERE